MNKENTQEQPKKDNTKKNMDIIDESIKQVFKNLMEFKKLNKDMPVSMNIQFIKEPEDILDKINETEGNNAFTGVYEDLDSIVIEDKHLYLTLFLPYPINNLMFDIEEDKNILVIAGNDVSFYKEFHFKVPVKKETLEVTHNNNILELKIEIKKE